MCIKGVPIYWIGKTFMAKFVISKIGIFKIIVRLQNTGVYGIYNPKALAVRIFFGRTFNLEKFVE